MAQGFCINKQLAAQLKAAAQAGDINMQELYEMNSAERRAKFEKYAPKDIAAKINSGFEESMVSSQKDALKKWVENTFTGKEKKAKSYPDVINKINDLSEVGMVDINAADSFLEDLVATKLGAYVTPAEVAEIAKRANKIQEIAEKGETNEFGLPSLEYFKAREGMQNYLNSLNPVSQTKILTGTIGRGTMLFSLKSPVTNIAGNSVMGLFTAMEKRLASGRLGGLNNNLVRNYVKTANQIYQQSGFDVTRMFSIGETFNTLGEKVISSQGEGAVRKIGRFYEDIVFKQMMGAPDIVFASIQFADTVNLASTELAYEQGLRGQAAKEYAAEIFKDATKIEPETETGKLVRAQAIADAQYATFTNDSKYAEVALGIRKIVNQASGDLRLGDLLMPFVKTPANVVGVGLDAAGLSGIRALYNMPTALAELKKGNKVPMRQVMRDGVRTGLGLTVAFIIAASFDPDEFIGEYPTTAKERELLELKNGTPNSFKIGDTWISADYFGPFAAPMMGIMYAKKYGDVPQEQALKYVQATVQSGGKLPGIDMLSQTLADMQAFAPGDDSTVEENVFGAVNSVTDQLSSRLIPSFISDLARVTDPNERNVQYDDPVAKLKAKIPGLRTDLPIRENIFGEVVTAENPASRLFFGSRVKKALDSDVIQELTRLDEAGQLPSITDVEKTSSKVKSYKAQVSAEKYDETLDRYQEELRDGIDKMIKSRQYERASDEDKKEMINDFKSDLLDKTLTRGGYRKR